MSYNPRLCCVVLSCSVCPTLGDPMNWGVPSSCVREDSPGKNAGVGCSALLQGIFPTLESNPGLPCCRWIFNPMIINPLKKFFSFSLLIFQVHFLQITCSCILLLYIVGQSLSLKSFSFFFLAVLHMWHEKFSTRDQIRAPCSGSAGS